MFYGWKAIIVSKQLCFVVNTFLRPVILTTAQNYSLNVPSAVLHIATREHFKDFWFSIPEVVMDKAWLNVGLA